ncbi:hypothetical protein H9Y04_45195 [Streptomyces sp. TRM66268-LWL]|uniref:Integral membrane protein n=1 Tax=Streptomyces polyasparticus TaxID=2767826 RepID=A0ABR7SZI2_9ACTN|nr:hypothetical protein [Streptomyces polyasparticus]MBC9719678.1 hypothetical protein [Streptomyces polyasparticus]
MRYAVIASGFALIALVLRAFVPRPIRMAGNGDGQLMTCRFALDHLQSAIPLGWGQFVFHPVATTACPHYPSSASIFHTAAKALTPLIGLPSALDLRFLTAIYLVLIACVVGLIATFTPLRTSGRISLAVALLLVAADPAFLGYTASAYGEAAGLLGILAAVPGLILLRTPGPARFVGLALFTTATALTVTAGPQLTLVVLPAAATLLRAKIPTTRLPSRLLPALCALVVLGTAVLYAHRSMEASATHADAYSAVTSRTLDGEQAPRADLRRLRLLPHFTRHSTTNTYMGPATGTHDPQLGLYSGSLKPSDIAAFYITHPTRIPAVLDDASRDMMAGREPLLGSFAPEGGKPAGAVENRVAFASGILESFRGLGLAGLVGLTTATTAVAMAAVRRRPHDHPYRTLALLIGYLLGVSAAAFVPAAFFEGMGPIKHSHFAAYALLLALSVAAALALAHLGQRLRRGLAPSPHSEPFRV